MLRECRDVVAAEAPAQPEVFALILARMALHFPENRLSPQEQKLVLKDWRRLLGDMPADILEATADAYVMSPARFFPTPGQFNAVAGPMWQYRKALARRAREALVALGEVAA